MYNLTGKVALVTGAARGIGRAIALRLAQEGARVAAADVDRAGLDELAGLFQARDWPLLPIVADVTDSAAVERMVDAVVAHYGGIDILVNNAGIIKVAPLIEMAEADWDRLFAVNVKGMWLCSRAVARVMIRQGRGGRIINAASRAGKTPSRLHYTGAYATTKHAVVGFTRALAFELAPHQITVNAYCPGVVDTPMWDLIDQEMTARLGLERGALKAQAVAQVPLGRIEQPEDVAKLVAFLASDEADYITGQAINVDGGTEVH